jgi:hypothetical protein
MSTQNITNVWAEQHVLVMDNFTLACHLCHLISFTEKHGCFVLNFYFSKLLPVFILKRQEAV